MNYKKEVFDYLKSFETIKHFKRDNYNYYLIKIPYNERIDLIYGDNTYSREIAFDAKLEYKGFYDKEKDQLYDIKYEMYNILGINWNESSSYLSMDELLEDFNIKLNNIITSYVKENKKEFYESAKVYNSNVKERDIYKHFINNIDYFDYKSDYKIIDSKILLNYFVKGDKYLHDIANDYIKSNKELIGKNLKDNDIRNKLLSDINNNLDNEIHKRKDILKLLKNSDYKNVNISIYKDNKCMNFKIATSALEYSWDSSYVSQYSMSVKDREKFKNIFGSREDFNLNDIYKIEFRNRIVYEDKSIDFDNIETKEEEISI